MLIKIQQSKIIIKTTSMRVEQQQNLLDFLAPFKESKELDITVLNNDIYIIGKPSILYKLLNCLTIIEDIELCRA